jgi:hypothetical protein
MNVEIQRSKAPKHKIGLPGGKVIRTSVLVI